MRLIRKFCLSFGIGELQTNFGIYIYRYMTRYDDWYLLTYTTNDNITLKRSHSLTDNWDDAETRVVFNPDPNSGEPWATDVRFAVLTPYTLLSLSC